MKTLDKIIVSFCYVYLFATFGAIVILEGGLLK